MAHCFIQCNTFPTSFPKAILEYILFDKVRDETFRESFYNYVSGHEKALILRCLWNMMAPTPLNILSNMDFTDFKSHEEERVASYLQRYINPSSPYNLELLLQFCTGCTSVDHNKKIKVEYVNHDSSYLNIASKTCFKILYIPRQIDSFNLFKTICDGSLQNPDAW